MTVPENVDWINVNVTWTKSICEFFVNMIIASLINFLTTKATINFSGGGEGGGERERERERWIRR